jgi:hypothetical protein
MHALLRSVFCNWIRVGGWIADRSSENIAELDVEPCVQCNALASQAAKIYIDYFLILTPRLLRLQYVAVHPCLQRSCS